MRVLACIASYISFIATGLRMKAFELPASIRRCICSSQSADWMNLHGAPRNCPSEHKPFVDGLDVTPWDVHSHVVVETAIQTMSETHHTTSTRPEVATPIGEN